MPPGALEDLDRIIAKAKRLLEQLHAWDRPADAFPVLGGIAQRVRRHPRSMRGAGRPQSRRRVGTRAVAGRTLSAIADTRAGSSAVLFFAAGSHRRGGVGGVSSDALTVSSPAVHHIGIGSRHERQRAISYGGSHIN